MHYDNEDPVKAGPRVLALGLKGFAEGVQRLAETMHVGMQVDATIEQRAAAEHAAHAVLRNSPAALRYLVRLEIAAEDITNAASDRRDDLMTAIFGPDKA